MISAGAIVTARRSESGIRRWMNPCITTWPAIVPTDDEARPEASSATPNMVAAMTRDSRRARRRRPDRRRCRRARASGIARRPDQHAMLISPAIVIAMTTSTCSKR